jgi:hypothetical protein
MLEIGAQHSLEYRREILSRLFNFTQGNQSFHLIGAASMGKTRLLDFLMRNDVQEHYLHEKAKNHWLVRVDLNRLAVKNESWAFYELLLSSLLLEVNDHANKGNLDVLDNLRVEIAQLDSSVIEKRDLLLALRFFEMAVNRLCHVLDLKICFLFDEFDETYETMPRDLFLQLRAVRDANKNRVAFGLFLRKQPDRLRPTIDNESFYELISRNRIGLTPYTYADAVSMILQLETRRDHPLFPDQRTKIFETSGGHPGTISAIISILIETPNSNQHLESPGWQEWISRQPTILEECRKIWNGLSAEEQEALKAFAKGGFDKIAPPVEKLLFIKGLLRHNGDKAQFFSQPFGTYVKNLRTP